MSDRRRRVGRGALWAGAALAALAAVWWAASWRGSGLERAEWAEVRRDDLRLVVPLTGTLKATESSQLGPPAIPELWDFKISFLAPEGAEVGPGDPVLGFDTSQLERKLEEKRAESAAAQKQIEKREIDLAIQRRDDELRLAEAQARHRRAALKVDRPPELASASDLEQARLDLDLAQREIVYLEARMDAARRAADAELASLRETRDRASARVREIEDAISRMTVTAPQAGTVIYISGWRDDKKKVGDSCWRAERVVEIPDLTRMSAVAEVDEADAGRVAEGQKVRLRLDAHPDLEFTGEVRSIWGTVQRKAWNNPLKIVRLDVDLDETDTRRMRPGMRFTGEVETGRVIGALVVPADAVFPTPEGPVAWRRSPMGAERVRLSLGRRNEKDYEVLEGLAEGDQVSRRDLGSRREGA